MAVDDLVHEQVTLHITQQQTATAGPSAHKEELYLLQPNDLASIHSTLVMYACDVGVGSSSYARSTTGKRGVPYRPIALSLP